MTTDCNKLDTVFRDFLTLKKLRRTGWQLRGIREGESIADHCFGVVLLTHLLIPEISNPQINREKAVAMAIIHELGETRIGDIPYTTLKYFPDKSKMEYDAITDVLEPLSANTKEETLKLFVEFEEGKTTEARFVKAIDKLEMLVTAAEYEKAGFSGLTDFWENPFTFKVFEEFQPLAQYAKYLLSKRRQRVNGEL